MKTVFAVLIVLTLACGVKSAPRPVEAALPPPVTMPTSQPVEK